MSPMMGGVNGVSNDSYSNSLRGLSGLSGLDRDGMIKTMTLRSRSRIAKYKQKLQKLNWKQEAMQGISDKMIEFSRKYLNVSSENSLVREATFNNYSVEAFGEFKNKVTATGSPSQLEGIHILGISGKASNDTYVSPAISGSGTITTGALDLTKPVHFGAIEGTTMDFRIGEKEFAKDYQVKFVAGNYDIYKRDSSGGIIITDGTPEIDEEKKRNVQALFEESFKNTEVRIGNNKYTMADFVKVGFEKNGKNIEVRIRVNEDFQVGGQALGSMNSLKVTGGTVFRKLGMNTVAEEGFDINSVPKGFMLTDTAKALIGGYTGDDNNWENIGSHLLLGGSMVFNLNGVKRTITFPDKRIPDAGNPDAVFVKKEGILYNLSETSDVAKYINKELADAYGVGNVSVALTGDTITFTAKPGASLSIHEGNGHLVGEENVFKLKDGSSNRVGMDINLRKGESSPIVNKLNEYAQTVEKEDGSGNKYASFSELLQDKSFLKFKINGNEIEIRTNKVTTLGDLIKELNHTENIVKRAETAGGYHSVFQVKYDGNLDSFVFQSRDKGANTLSNPGSLWEGSDAAPTLESALFGTYDAAGYTAGVNAKVFYRTAESTLVKELDSFDNTFMINNARFQIEGGFNVNSTGGTSALIDGSTEGVSFKGKVNADKLVETVKNLIKDYNEMVKIMGTQFKTMAERSKSTSKLKYEPLTDEQKEKMSEKEIEKWEAKAKEGILFGDTVLKSARDELASVLYYSKSSVSDLAKLGIRQSPYNVDSNGSLEFDEAAFRKAIGERPEEVKNIFLGDNAGNVGFAHHFKNTLARNASDTGTFKGSLVERAGSKYAPGSVFTNMLFKEMDSLKKTIDFYEKRLKNDEDRYIKRFSALERIMKKAEMQSGYIMNLQGY